MLKTKSLTRSIEKLSPLLNMAENVKVDSSSGDNIKIIKRSSPYKKLITSYLTPDTKVIFSQFRKIVI